jgi:hypothetical protein
MTLKLTSTLALLSIVSGTAFSADLPRNKALDRMMYTINPQIQVSGPVYKDQSDSATKSKYASDLVRIILKEAHQKGLKYLEAGDTQAYYSIMTLALTVPLQEGLYIQFRNVEGADVCKAEANSGELVKKSGETNYTYFNQYFKSPERVFLPNCEEIKTNNVTQLIRGGDGTDLSVMQVSIRWHFADFLANKKYESVQQTINYGLGHLMNGFNPVYRNIGEYKCISEAGGIFKKKKISYINLVRGIWAGQYNSGSITKTCRFEDSASPYKHHDKGFEKNLNKILDFNGTLSVDMIGEFKFDSDVAESVKEIAKNLKEATNNRTALDAVLK